ncbi:MAG: PrsW family intramembrane metalloprotease, partial [Planctomycetales bacterium]
MIWAMVGMLLAAAAPAVAYVMIAWWLDRHEKEPIWLLVALFLWGAAPAVVLVLFADSMVREPLEAMMQPREFQVFSPVMMAPPIEELCKALPLLLVFLFYRREFDGPADGLLYGAMVGFGFSMTEDFFYFLMQYGSNGVEGVIVLFVLRSLAFGLNHALYTSLFGLGLGIARYATHPAMKFGAPALGLAAGISLHMLHNFLAAIGGYYGVPDEVTLMFLFASFLIHSFGGVCWLGVMIAAGFQEARWIREELVEEVENGVLTKEQAWGSHHYRDRIRARMKGLAEKGAGHYHRLGSLYSTAADLAFKKRQHRLFGDEDGNLDEISRLREELRR